MMVEHAEDFSWVRGSCADCGLRITYELPPEAFNEKRFGRWLTASAKLLRSEAKHRLRQEFVEKGCPHADRADDG